MKRIRAVRWLALALCGAASIGLVAVSASNEADEGKGPKTAAGEVAVGEPETTVEDVTIQLGDLQIAIDPETGDLRPLTRQEAAHLANEMRRRFPPRVIGEPTLRPDGSMSAIVAPNVLRFSVARIQDDGAVALDCTDGTEDAIEHLTHLAESPAPQPRGVK